MVTVLAQFLLLPPYNSRLPDPVALPRINYILNSHCHFGEGEIDIVIPTDELCREEVVDALVQLLPSPDNTTFPLDSTVLPIINYIKALLKPLHTPIYRRRVSVLSELIVPHLNSEDRILDIGCGAGELGHSVLSHPACPTGITYLGVEKCRRSSELIEIVEHHEGPMPFAEDELDIVILADVLHHEEHEEFLLSEATRIAKRLVIVKDHKPDGILGFWRICFLDWLANHPYGVKCLYRYHTLSEWRTLIRNRSLTQISEQTSIDLYPLFFNFIFGRNLQYFTVLKATEIG